jgi:LmbE family N-acetylglucosaminyl deacetylase
MKNILLLISLFTLGYKSDALAQSSTHIKLQLEKLAKTERVLYLAAHPDDENTRLISYLENDLKVRTAYLSLTRGDGGQNLIGTEKGAELGVLRTQELLEARKTDGAEQFFTRAVDFGYSKNPEETFTKWNKDDILHDVVWVIRNFQPTIIITRFPPNSKAGHGHHTASALLAEEAFALAGNPKAYPAQLQLVNIWQPTLLYQNTSTWWDKSLPEKALKTDSIIALNVGGFNPLLGLSYGEIASMARSKHRCQGFGSALQRGDNTEYLTLLKSTSTADFTLLKASNWPLKAITKLIIELNANFDYKAPEKSIKSLVSLLKQLKTIKNKSNWIDEKTTLTKDLILACAGVSNLWYSENETYTPQDSITVFQKLIVRNTSNLVPTKSSFNKLVKQGYEVTLNEEISNEFKTTLPKNISYTTPYYLENDYENMYDIVGYNQLGLAENKATLVGTTTWNFDGYTFETNNEVNYNFVDRSIGEITSPTIITPVVSITFNNNLLITSNQSVIKSNITLTNNTNTIQKGTLKAISNNSINVTLNDSLLVLNPNESFSTTITITPNKGATKEQITFSFNDALLQTRKTIDYDHITKQTITGKAVLTVQNIKLAIGNEKIAYISGSGDEVASYLSLIGYDVTLINDDEINVFKPNDFDVIVLGIRALNVNTNITGISDKLNQFVNNGGRLIVQYNTNRGLIKPFVGPLSFTISRDRVTVEEAKATLLNPNHPVLLNPNTITDLDFDNWVQERGLYFADAWDEAFTPIISWNDPDEEPSTGGLIIGKSGKGTVVYTGISFFRQLPTGVPGAFKLLSNIISHKYD